MENTYVYNERQYAAFGQLDYDFLPNLHGAFGVRYGYTSESYYSTEIGFYQIPNISPFYQNAIFHAFTPKITLGYDRSAASNLNEYGLFEGPNKFNPDSLWTYELGSKNRLLDNHLSIDAAICTTRWTAIQQALYLPTCGYYFTANVGDARIYGGEIEINYRPVSQLTLGLSGDAQHAYLSDAYNPAEAAYSHKLKTGGALVSRVDFAYQGESYGSYQPIDFITGTANPNYLNPGYGVLNASFGYTGKLLELSVYAKNFANDRKIIQQPEVNTVFEAYTVHPRVVGVRAQLNLN